MVGDSRLGSDTLCDTTLCNDNEHVRSHVCTVCPDGTTSASGSDASGADTTCTRPPDGPSDEGIAGTPDAHHITQTTEVTPAPADASTNNAVILVLGIGISFAVALTIYGCLRHARRTKLATSVHQRETKEQSHSTIESATHLETSSLFVSAPAKTGSQDPKFDGAQITSTMQNPEDLESVVVRPVEPPQLSTLDQPATRPAPPLGTAPEVRRRGKRADDFLPAPAQIAESALEPAADEFENILPHKPMSSIEAAIHIAPPAGTSPAVRQRRMHADQDSMPM